jgi:hypothetical protein
MSEERPARAGHRVGLAPIIIFAAVLCSVAVITVLATRTSARTAAGSSVSSEKFKAEKLTQGARAAGGGGQEELIPLPPKAEAGEGVFSTETGFNQGNAYDIPCKAPTGFLRRIIEVRRAGFTSGVVNHKGIELDLGQPGSGRFYDVAHTGCCDTYCRILSTKGYFSCVGPTTVATQFERAYEVPGGHACAEFGRHG